MERSAYIVSVQVRPLEEGGFLAVCPDLPGCHAEGQSVAEALDNLQDVARNLLELRAEDGLPLPPGLKEVSAGEKLSSQILVTIGN